MFSLTKSFKLLLSCYIKYLCQKSTYLADFCISHADDLNSNWLLDMPLREIIHQHCKNTSATRMWANAQRDGRPAKYRWRPLFNATKFRWRPLLECRAVTLPRRESCWNLYGCPKLANRSQPLVCRSSPYYEDMWRRYWCLTTFFRLSIHALVPKI